MRNVTSGASTYHEKNAFLYECRDVLLYEIKWRLENSVEVMLVLQLIRR